MPLMPHAPGILRRSMVPVPIFVLMRLSRSQTMYSSNMPMGSSILTPMKLRLWKKLALVLFSWVVVCR